ncbi:hypothetical protein FQZ97_1203610 [compost metagenome]
MYGWPVGIIRVKLASGRSSKALEPSSSETNRKNASTARRLWSRTRSVKPTSRCTAVCGRES